MTTDVAKLFTDTLTENHGAIPHPNGEPVHLAQFNASTFPPGLREQIAEEHAKTLTAIGQALAHVLTTNGYATVPTSRLAELETKEKAFDGVRPPQGTLTCPACGTATAQVNITNPERIPASTATLRTLKCACPE